MVTQLYLAARPRTDSLALLDSRQTCHSAVGATICGTPALEVDRLDCFRGLKQSREEQLNKAALIAMKTQRGLVRARVSWPR
jgi:hypothetical protein